MVWFTFTKHFRSLEVVFWSPATVTLLSAVGFATFLETAAQANAETGVRTAQPIPALVVERDILQGRVVAGHSVDITSRVSGVLSEIAIADGSMVSAGDLLFRFDEDRAKERLQLAKQKLASAEQAELLLRQTTEEEFRSGMSEAQAAVFEAGDLATKHRIALAQVRLAMAEVEHAELDLAFHALRAPIKGLLTLEDVSVGELIRAGVNGGQILASLRDMSNPEVDFNVPLSPYLSSSTYAGLRSLQKRNLLKVDVLGWTKSGPIQIKATVTYIANRVDAATQTVQMRARLNDPQTFFSLGQRVMVVIERPTKTGFFAIPHDAILSANGRTFVQVKQSGRTQMRTVRVKATSTTYALVSADLAPDDAILLLPDATEKDRYSEPAADK